MCVLVYVCVLLCVVVFDNYESVLVICILAFTLFCIVFTRFLYFFFASIYFLFFCLY